ncbi:hypothetical protein WN48_07072 [Eufriesea mexicana]|uniref:Uncharacterized protein n=1 Tax=Eufriesea mexicana TaxID=516756 RepID=A0A310SWL2_9HYME|nr:hypothetical protein WN48_07072 [Eufriesea mexicana]
MEGEKRRKEALVENAAVLMDRNMGLVGGEETRLIECETKEIELENKLGKLRKEIVKGRKTWREKGEKERAAWEKGKQELEERIHNLEWMKEKREKEKRKRSIVVIKETEQKEEIKKVQEFNRENIKVEVKVEEAGEMDKGKVIVLAKVKRDSLGKEVAGRGVKRGNEKDKKRQDMQRIVLKQ